MFSQAIGLEDNANSLYYAIKISIKMHSSQLSYKPHIYFYVLSIYDPKICISVFLIPNPEFIIINSSFFHNLELSNAFDIIISMRGIFTAGP